MLACELDVRENSWSGPKRLLFPMSWVRCVSCDVSCVRCPTRRVSFAVFPVDGQFVFTKVVSSSFHLSFNVSFRVSPDVWCSDLYIVWCLLFHGVSVSCNEISFVVVLSRSLRYEIRASSHAYIVVTYASELHVPLCSLRIVLLQNAFAPRQQWSTFQRIIAHRCRSETEKLNLGDLFSSVYCHNLKNITPLERWNVIIQAFFKA